MIRLLWSAVATLVIIAIGAPCLTFYLLIKEYWTEVGNLRQELLLCQLGSPDPPVKSPFLGQGSFEDGLSDEVLPFLPVPQRLTSHLLRGENRLDDGPTKVDVIASGNVNDLEPKDDIVPQKDQSLLQNLHQPEFVLERKPDMSPTPILEDAKISDQQDTKKVSFEDEKTICVDRDYLQKVEKRAMDLSERVAACRKCLDPPRQKESKCGGGPSWREYRRKERLARKEIRDEKRRRRKKEKTTKDIESETTGESRVPAPSPQANLSSYLGSRPEDYQSQDTHNMRENHRASTDFRRGFNQKISRMDEALMQFTETQSAFCKELRDNLGGSLEKRGQELEALSEQIAALVRTTTLQVAMIEKLTSDQVYAGQASIEKNLANLQTMRDEQVRSVQDFHKTTFLPAMVTLTSLLGEQASSVTNMGVDLITKVEMLQDVFLTFSTQQGDTLIKLSEQVDMFASKHSNLIMRSRDHAKHLHINTENFIRELQTRMNNVVKELVLVRLQSQSFISLNENTYHEISASLNKTKDAVDTLKGDLHRRIEKAKSEEGDFRTEFRQETDLINGRIQSGISDVLIHNHAAVTQIGEVELETRVFSKNTEASWNEMYANQEMELRQEADMLANNLRSHNHHTQNILTGLQGTAGTHEQVLEQQRMDFQSFVRKRQDALDTQCSSISDWAFLMSSELRRRDEDLHRFLSEDLHISPVTAQEVSEYDGFLASRLPDGTLVYDSSSDNFGVSGRSASNVTSRSGEVAYETSGHPSLVNSSSDQSSTSSPDKLSLANSSRSGPPPHEVLINSSQGEAHVTPPLTLLSEEKEEDIPSRGDLAGGKRLAGGSANTTPSEHSDALSNDIKVSREDELDNAISHQSDQGMPKNRTEAVVVCRNETNSTNILKMSEEDTLFREEDDDDKEFRKLQEILLEAKKTILRFRKEFQTQENFRELKTAVWQNLNKTVNKTSKINRFSALDFFNYTLIKTEKAKESPTLTLMNLPRPP